MSDHDSGFSPEGPETAPDASRPWHGLKPVLSPTISFGNLVMIIGVLLPMGFYILNNSVSVQQRHDALAAALQVESAVRAQQFYEQRVREKNDVANLQAEIDSDAVRSQNQMNEIKAILQDIQHRINQRWERSHNGT